MDRPDFNLLIMLDAVLSEGSVARAAKRLGLSPSAMSRALARLRETTGDPLLVRAGRGLVPTPRATELRERVQQLAQDVEEVLRPASKPDLTQLKRTFTVRAREGFVENYGMTLISRAAEEAPGVRFRFVRKGDKESASLRDAMIDVEVGVVGRTTSPEIRAHALFTDHFVGVVREGHALCRGNISPVRYAGGGHIGVSRRGLEKGLVDEVLIDLGLERDVITVVNDFNAALVLARASDLIATVPEQQTVNLRTGMHQFALPVALPPITISLMWHPRYEADAAHSWFRALVIRMCTVP